MTLNQLSLWIFIVFFCVYSEKPSAENVSDKIIRSLVNKKLPTVLYEHQDKPWDMGIYSLKINKLSPVNFSSDKTHLNLSIPIKAIVSGKIKKKLFGVKITIGCDSKITTNICLNILPKMSPEGTQVKVSVSIPIPDTKLDCDGVKIPIREILEQLVLKNKSDWENDLESDINKFFKKIGI